MNNYITYCFLALGFSVFAQTKVSGTIFDENNETVPFAVVAFKSTTERVMSNEKGIFYIESKVNRDTLVVSCIGYNDKEIRLTKSVLYDFKIKLVPAKTLSEVVVFSGKTSKKNNPAIDILKKIWARKRKNGLNMYKQYQMERYEKIEFDLNSIDSAYKANRVFKGMEFVFDYADTSSVTGKTYLPVFINESISDVYGDNVLKKTKEVEKANKTVSGFEGNQHILSFIEDLYTEYNIYDNYMFFFDKKFASPLSTLGVDTYNYILKDSAYIDNKLCFNIVFYPRRKNELTFKGNFWVNDTTFAIKKIAMSATKGANINWVKDIYLEQEFETLNDSVFLLERDHLMTDFAIRKSELSKGIYGKRTALYRNHVFNKELPEDFYKEHRNEFDPTIYKKPENYWEENRFEDLNKDEKGVYKMLDSLNKVDKFVRMVDYVTILTSGYISFKNFDYGSLLSTIGYNEVEGFRLQGGIRTYFDTNDPWRISGFLAYGFKDEKFKYGVSGKWMFQRKNRLIISGGYRTDIEQLGATLTTTNEVLKRNFASTALFTTSTNDKLSSITVTNLGLQGELAKNLTLMGEISQRYMYSASPTFSLDYYTTLPTAENPAGEMRGDLKQTDLKFDLEFTPNKKYIGYGVERRVEKAPYTNILLNYTHGFDNLPNSFKYNKVQFYVKHPFFIGRLGRTDLILETGKIFGTVPLGLLSVVPGNQTYFTLNDTFSNLNYYEFVTDQYVMGQWQHNFHGKIFARIPLVRKLNLRELIGIKGVYGTVSDENSALNASGLVYQSPENIYWEYNAGIGNIFNVFRLDFSWRGSYLDAPDISKFSVKLHIAFTY